MSLITRTKLEDSFRTRTGVPCQIRGYEPHYRIWLKIGGLWQDQGMAGQLLSHVEATLHRLETKFQR